jgi:CheY-like chemotaxis protein
MSPWPDRNEPTPSGKLRVLIVDDEPTLRLGFAYALADGSTDVETAASGQEALEFLTNRCYDVMVLDLRMPDLDGIGVIHRLRSRGNDMPIVLCSAALHPNAATRAIGLGVVDFLLKPVRPVDLRQVIHFVLHPEMNSFSQAMAAARNRHHDAAVDILEKIASPDLQSLCWLNVFRFFRDSNSTLDSNAFHDQLRSSLAVLAFNSPTVS